jgi:hypothetical protein
LSLQLQFARKLTSGSLPPYPQLGPLQSSKCEARLDGQMCWRVVRFFQRIPDHTTGRGNGDEALGPTSWLILATCFLRKPPLPQICHSLNRGVACHTRASRPLPYAVFCILPPLTYQHLVALILDVTRPSRIANSA